MTFKNEKTLQKGIFDDKKCDFIGSELIIIFHNFHYLVDTLLNAIDAQKLGTYL